MLSHTADYALRAALQIAARSEEGPIGVALLARELRIPQNYLSKILNRLASEGVLVSIRGKKGGFRLGRAARSLRLLDVVGPFDSQQRPGACLLGRSRCNDSQPCAAHGRWRAVQEQWISFFRETTLADLVAEEGKDRLDLQTKPKERS